MILLSIKRRKKEIRYVSIVAFIAAFFMAGLVLFQDVMNWYVMEQNYQNYGNWVISSSERQSHPFFLREGKAVTAASLGGMVETELDEGETEGAQEFSHFGVELGYIDTNLKEFGNIRLYEGRMPEKSNEIAIDRSSLAKMGYNYNIGQTIKVMWMEYGENSERIMEKDYELVGTLYNFASTWGKSDLPNALVSEGELNATYSIQRQRVSWFYQLNPEYKDMDTKELADAIAASSEEETIIWNSYVYANQLWGTADSVKNVSYVMIGIAAFAIGYLLSSYMSKRRKTYYRYRCMGASIGDVRKMILIECLYATIPAAALGIVLAYLIAWGGCTYVSGLKNLPNFFRFEISILGRQVAAIIIVILLSVGWNILTVRDRKLVQQTSSIPVKKLAALGRFAAKSKAPEKDFIRRYHKLHASSYRLSIMISLLIGGMLVLCSNQVNYQAFIEYELYDSVADYEMFKSHRKRDVLDGTYMVEGRELYRSTIVYESSVGLNSSDVDILENTWGIDSVKCTLIDDSLRMEWEGQEESLLLKSELIMEHAIDFWIPESKDAIIPALRRDGLADQIDWEAWENGDAIIVYIQDSFWNEEIQAFETRIDDTIHVGDVVDIKSLDGEVQVSATVAAVGYSDNSSFCDNFDFMRTGYTLKEVGVFASRNFAQKCVGEGEEVVEGNHVRGYYNTLSSYEATDKLIAEFATERKMDYISDAEWRKLAYREIVQKISIYAALFVMMLSVFIVLQKNFTDSRNHYRSEQYLLFKKIGMTEKQYIKVVMKTAVREYAWIFGGILVGYAIDGAIYAQRQWTLYTDEYSYYSKLLERMVYTRLETALDYLIMNLNHWMTLVVVVAVFALMMGSFWLQTRAYTKQDNIL